MTRVKFLFDECALGVPALAAIRNVLKFNPQTAELDHVISRFGAGAKDDDWIPTAAIEGWIVVTADSGRHKSRGGKLPLLCEQFGVTHIVMSTAVNKLSSFGRQRAIIDNWEAMVGVADEPRGSRFSLRMVGSQGRTTLVFVKCPEPGTGKVQQELF